MHISNFVPMFVMGIGALISSQNAYSAPILGTNSTFEVVLPFVPNPASSLSALIAIGPPSASCFVVGACQQIALLQGLNSSAAGTIYTFDSAAPNFTGIVSALTNGSLDQISLGIVLGPSYGTSSGGGVGFPETAFGTSPDFAGQTIGSVVLRIDGVTIQPTNFRLDYTLTVFGASSVPEPSSWLPLAGGLALMFLCLRAKR
jgi:hypothetical protein